MNPSRLRAPAPDAPAMPQTPPTPGAESRPRERLAVSVLTPVYNERHLVAPSLARVLALHDERIARLELIVVDDHSTDGSWEAIQSLAADPRVRLIRHDAHRGKGAALRTAIGQATGDVCVFHGADMEYEPADIPALLRPFLEEGADAVYGSRFMAAPYRRALMHRRTVASHLVTSLVCWATDLHLSDVETGYKAVNTSLLQSIPLRSDDYRVDVELTLKLAKRRARVFEAPIRYLPRHAEEGRKIRARDAWLALLALLRFSVVDDVYQEDAYGSHILTSLQQARRFNRWMGDTLRPFLGDRILEIGAGLGSLTAQFIPRERYVASDINLHYLGYLRSYAIGKPYLTSRFVDANCPEHFEALQGQFNTALMVNVLEHVPDEQATLRNLHRVLEPGGRAVILVPQHPALFGTLDTALEHRERYSAEGLRASLQRAGFRVETVCDFNRVSVPSWFMNGRILRRTGFSRVQLKVLEVLMPLFRRIDRIWPWSGLSLIAVGIKEE